MGLLDKRAPKRTVACEDELRVDSVSTGAHEDLEQIVHTFDLCHPAEPPDQEATIRHTELRSLGRCCFGTRNCSAHQIKPKTDHLELLRCSNAERHELVAHLRAYCDQLVRSPRKGLLD